MGAVPNLSPRKLAWAMGAAYAPVATPASAATPMPQALLPLPAPVMPEVPCCVEGDWGYREGMGLRVGFRAWSRKWGHIGCRGLRVEGSA